MEGKLNKLWILTKVKQGIRKESFSLNDVSTIISDIIVVANHV